MRMARQEAIAAKATRYFGKMCEKHAELGGERLTSNSHCTRCAAGLAQKRKHKGNPGYEAKLAYNRVGGAGHEKHIARMRKGGSGHVGLRVHVKARKARQLQSLFRGFRKEVAAFYAACPENKTVDHVIPLKRKDPVTKQHVVCGLHVPWNLQYLTNEENIKKSCWFVVE